MKKLIILLSLITITACVAKPKVVDVTNRSVKAVTLKKIVKKTPCKVIN